MIWEEDLQKKFKEIIMPTSYSLHKYPFLQVRMPQHPDSIDQNKYKANLYPTQNIEFSSVKHTEDWVKLDDSKYEKTKAKYETGSDVFEEENDTEL